METRGALATKHGLAGSGNLWLPTLPPPPFWMVAAQFTRFPWRNSSDDKPKPDTCGLIVTVAKTMQLR
jgi:hypothetical protein